MREVEKPKNITRDIDPEFVGVIKEGGRVFVYAEIKIPKAGKTLFKFSPTAIGERAREPLQQAKTWRARWIRWPSARDRAIDEVLEQIDHVPRRDTDAVVGARIITGSSALAPKSRIDPDRFAVAMETFMTFLQKEVYNKKDVLAMKPLEMQQRVRNKLDALARPGNILAGLDPDSLVVYHTQESVGFWVEMLDEEGKPIFYKLYLKPPGIPGSGLAFQIGPWTDYAYAALGMRGELHMANKLVLDALVGKQDGSEITQGQAAKILAASDLLPARRILLAAFLQGGVQLQEILAIPLAQSNLPNSRQAILDALRNPSPRVRALCAEATRYLQVKPEEIVQKLVPLLSDSERLPQLAAAESLAKFGDRRGLEHLLRLFHSGQFTESISPLAGSTLLLMLWKEEPERCASTLLAISLEDPDESIRLSAAFFLNSSRHPKILQGLKDSLDSHSARGFLWQ